MKGDKIDKNKGEKEIIAWRAFYIGGRQFNSVEHTWEELPQDELLVVVLYQNLRADNNFPYRRIMSGADYYFLQRTKRGNIWGCGMHDDRIPQRYPGAIIKKGKWTIETEIYDVIDKANKAWMQPV